MQEQLHFSKMNDSEVEKILQENKIGLTVSEARKIETMLGRSPTLTEAIIWGIQGSEHSSYKSSRPYLMKLPTDGPNIIMGPKEDAGIVELCEVEGEKWGIVVGHESHNHPSQIVPYEGAATGIGGCVRDIACMGAKVIGCLDPLRFGDIHRSQNRLIAKGVVEGIAGYGNPIGVPNLGGDIEFNDSFNENCLVNVVAAGLVREKDIIHSFVPQEAADVGYDLIIVGKPTDQSGMGGAAFASIELNEDDKEANKGAVQEPNPFLKRHILASTYALFDELKNMNLPSNDKERAIEHVAFKDMGAGGNLCATIELAEGAGFGADVDLSKIHVALEGLHPSVIACSETQERFTWAVHPDLTQMVLDHYNKKWALPDVSEGARASLVGKVKHGNYTLTYNGDVLCDADPKDITAGLQYDREVKAQVKDLKEPELEIENSEIQELFLKMISGENLASRKPVFEGYDKQVQGMVKIEAGEADSSIITPLLDEDVPTEAKNVGALFGIGGISRYSRISPYYQGVNAVVEAMRNVAAVGGTPQAMTDCLNYGNPEKPEQMWEFSEGIRGIAEAANTLKLKEHAENATPYISGNVSLYNESKTGSIDASTIICCIGNIMNADKGVTTELKEIGSKILLVGARKDELGASEFYKMFDKVGANVPAPDLEKVKYEIYGMIDAVDNGLVLAAHDISVGGMITALAEMTYPTAMQNIPENRGQIGLNINLEKTPLMELGSLDLKDSNLPNQPSLQSETIQKLFSETGGFLLEVKPENVEAVQEIFTQYGVEAFEIGETTDKHRFVIEDGEEKVVDLGVDEVVGKWENGLREKL